MHIVHIRHVDNFAVAAVVAVIETEIVELGVIISLVAASEFRLKGARALPCPVCQLGATDV